MGIIDLSARVSALEKNDTSSCAELDQLEAAVTAIENQLTVTVTDISEDLETLPSGMTVTFAYMETYGSLCSVTFKVENEGDANEEVPLYQIPADKIPYTPYSFTANTESVYLGYSGDDLYVYFDINTNTSMEYSVQWLANPAPTPGE